MITNLARNGPYNKFISIFNRLSKLTKEEQSTVMFKKNLRHLLIKEVYYKMEEIMED